MWKRSSLLASVSCVLALTAPVLAEEPEGVQWNDDLAQALEDARAQGRKVLVYVLDSV